MPTLATIGPFHFFFYSNEGYEPPHVHVKRDRDVAKFWLNPVALVYKGGFKDHELNKIERHVFENREDWMEQWHEYFRTTPAS